MDLAPNSSCEEFYIPGTPRPPAALLSNDDLERRLASLVAFESGSTADVVEHIAEFERRKLFAPKCFPSMFEYCTKVFGYSEGAAYLRIYAGRLSLEYPDILELLRTRRLHLTAIRTVGPHLKACNQRELLARCVSKSERELKFLVAELAPQPEPMEVVRRLPDSQPSRPPDSSVPAQCARPTAPSDEPPALKLSREQPAARAKIEPIAPRRVRFAFTGSDVFLGNVDRVRQLLRHKYPLGASEDVLSEVIDYFLKSKDPALKKHRARPRTVNPLRRDVPVWVKDIVFARDGGRCAFQSTDGARCEERGGLEYDHVVPWALGGVSNDPKNIRILCRSHNAYVGEQVFGSHRKSAEGGARRRS